VTAEHFDDPVAAYERLAAHYGDLSRRRELYLRGVEREIIWRIPPGGRSLLDVGAGDGARSLRIACQRGIERVVLVEPSREMAAKAAERAEVWPVRAEDLSSGCFGSAEENNRSVGPGTGEVSQLQATAERFDVITCLWNVLGHVPTAEKRLLALSAIARLLAPQSRFFLDVNHRYNLRSYGIVLTSARWIHDLFSPGDANGDVLAKWNTGKASISAYGHVFTHREIMRLADAAGLEMEGRVIMDYESGRTCRFAFQGNLLYTFRRSPRIASSSAPQTS
jgi:2-polyprenyl-3-methyl-5-hydroxy-6-metoxy-1,4-benzoquinol methylase